jgi:PAS domain S-box-containing protein
MEKEAKIKKELIEDPVDLRQQPADVKKSRSETKNILQALQASETRYRRLFETAQDGILILNAETGEIDDVNPYMIDMLHYSREELLGMKLWEVSPFKDTVLNRAAFEELQDKGYIRYKDLPLETKEGKPVAVEFVSNVYKANGNKVIQCNIRNITERKELDRKLQEAVLFQQRLIDALPVPVFYKDSEGRYLGCNSSFEKFFGNKKEEVTGKSVYELSPKEFADLYHEKDRALLQNPGIQIYESTVKDRGGVVHNVIFHKATFSNMDGSVGGLIGAILDITDRKRAEVQLHASLREKDILLREIHHRVKNNMQVIIGLLDLQASSSGNPELMEMLNKGQSRIRSMALVHEKLYASKDFTRINLAGYLRTLSQDLFQSYKINPGKIDLIIQTDGVYVDINKAIPCGLVLNELISNVLKHAFPGDRQGELQIIIREEKNTEMEIVVRDNGMGLPDDVDIHQPRTMGLNLVNGLVKKQLKGQMEVRRDNGTEIRIKFPL